jgi:hypothetical protein
MNQYAGTAKYVINQSGRTRDLPIPRSLLDKEDAKSRYLAARLLTQATALRDRTPFSSLPSLVFHMNADLFLDPGEIQLLIKERVEPLLKIRRGANEFKPKGYLSHVVRFFSGEWDTATFKSYTQQLSDRVANVSDQISSWTWYSPVLQPAPKDKNFAEKQAEAMNRLCETLVAVRKELVE